MGGTYWTAVIQMHKYLSRKHVLRFAVGEGIETGKKNKKSQHQWHTSLQLMWTQ